MSESKFLPFQDTDGDLHNDKCKLDDVVAEQKVCPTCTPNESAILPNWKEPSDPYLNEKNCKYQIGYRTSETGTGYESDNPTASDELVLERIYGENEEAAITELLEFYNKETTAGAIQFVQESIEHTDYYLQARLGSRLKLLYSVPHDILEAVGDEAPDEEESEEESEEEASALEITYDISDLEEKLMRVRKGLKLYSRYYKIFKNRGSSAGTKFVFQKKGTEFFPKHYGDFGSGANSKGYPAKLEKAYQDLVKFFKDKGYYIRPSRAFGFKEPVTELTFSFDTEYNLKKIKFLTQNCGSQPITYTKNGKLKKLLEKEGWRDKTAVAYFAKLDDMDADLQARTPKPWADFFTEHTYPPISLVNANEVLAAVQTGAGCLQEAIENKAASLVDGLSDMEFGISDAIIAKYYELYCSASKEEVEKLKEDLGIYSRKDRKEKRAKEKSESESPSEYRKARRQKVKDAGEDIWDAAQAQAYDTLQNEGDPFSVMCSSLLSSGIGDGGSYKELFNNLKICGLKGALLQSIQCLFAGLTLEQVLAKTAEAALKGMNIQNFNDLFFGLPAEQQQELNELAKKKLKEGDFFQNESDLQNVSDSIVDFDSESLKRLEEDLGGDSPAVGGPVDESGESTYAFSVSGSYTEYGAFLTEADPNAETRTLAKKFTNPSSGLNKDAVFQAYVAALLEYYTDNLLELVDQLNRFPGAQLITNALMALDCPKPPIFNPTVFDFIKDLELPFCRNIDDIALPVLVNPAGWLPDIKNIFAILMALLKQALAEMLISIICKLILKICELIGSALCKALGLVGTFAGNLATGAGRNTLDAILRQTLCGDNATDEDLNNTLLEMFANFGVGAEAFNNSDETLALVESMANNLTVQEMVDALQGNMSSEAANVLSVVVQENNNAFAESLGTPTAVRDFFGNVGSIMPPDAIASLDDLTPDDEFRTVNPSFCATPEKIEDFCATRSAILTGRASPQQISDLCDAELSALANNIDDLLPALENLDDFIADNMPPITSDPGCENGLLPYEPEETIQAVAGVLGNDLQVLQVAYSKDMLGNGPLEKNWGLVNMMMSDTSGLPLTAHIRKARLNPFYVDQYGSVIPDQNIYLAAVAQPAALFALYALDAASKNGAYPTKVAVYLQKYMNGENDYEGLTDIVSIDYSNNIETPQEKKVDYGDNFPAVPRAEVSVEYDDAQEPESYVITFDVRKSEPDITLSFRDNARGYRELKDRPYEYGFDLEGFTAEVEDQDGDYPSNIKSDNMYIKIIERVNNIRFKGLNQPDKYEIDDSNSDFAVSEPEEESEESGDTEVAIKYEFFTKDNTFEEIGDDLEEYTSFQNTFISKNEYQPQTILLYEIINKQTGKQLMLNSLDSYRDETSKTIMENIFETVANRDSDSTAWHYGYVSETLTPIDTSYGINDNGTWVPYNDTEYKNEDMVLGISYDQFQNDVSGTLSETRVFYLDPAEFGGSYRRPLIYVKPPAYKGWFGLIDALFPEFSPCKPQSTNLVDFDSIQAKIDEVYPNIPEDERLKSSEDCIVEYPYNRVLERPAKAAMIGLIMAACRIYASAHIIKTLPTFAKFSPRFPEVFSSAYASYIIEDIKYNFINNARKFQLFNVLSDENFWYQFLEQSVQMYSERVDSGEIEPPQDVIEALTRLNNMQTDFEYAFTREDAPDIGTFQRLKKYREEKNIEAIKQTEDDAKIVMKEWVVEQLNFMSERLITNLENVGFAPDIKDIDYYMLEQFTAGSSLTINQTMDSFGLVEASYGDLPTIPYDDNDEAAPIEVNGTTINGYYTYGGEFVIKEGTGTADSLQVGQEYVGTYHVHLNEMGDIIYMVGEEHTETSHATLSPLSTITTVAIGDVAEIDSVTDYQDQPFLLEKYISINGEKMTTTNATAEIGSNSDLTQLVSDVYPGTMELIYSRSPKTQSPSVEGTPVGIKGELGVRYGLKFSCIIDDEVCEITSVEIDALDLPLSEFKTLSANSLNLYCLIKELKSDSKFKMVSKYIIPMGKFTALTAIYNDLAMLASIGQFTTEDKKIFATDMADKISTMPGFDGASINTYLNEEEIDEDILAAIDGAWSSYDDRKDRNGVFVLSWDEWDRETLQNSTYRMKKLFETYYDAREFDISKITNNSDGPGKLFEKSLRGALKPAAGRQILPWFKRRDLTGNPFNSLGELCKKEDIE